MMMEVRKAYKFRLKNLSKTKEEKFRRFCGSARFVWNKCLSLNISRLHNKQYIMFYNELDFFTKLWKKSDEYGFINECPSQIIQQKLMDLNKAIKDGFDKTQPNKRLPKFKSKGDNDSIRFPQGFKVKGNQIFLPKLGWISFRKTREIKGKMKNVTISYKAPGWYVSIQVEQNVEQPIHSAKSIVGIDMGIKRFLTLSTGEYYKPKDSFKLLEKILAKAQRSLARKKKFSNNWKKQKYEIQKIHAKIANIRRDYLHKCSNEISKNHAMIVMEDLQVSNMSRSAKGTIDNPGKNVKAKSGLNRSILDQGWYEFKRQLIYKQKWRGGDVIFVSPRNTSITCPEKSCRHISKENRKEQSSFKCEKCGYKENADYVGAVNVLRAGHVRLACGDIGNISFQAQESHKVVA